ncbi:MAG: hypothetical protein A2096_09975 [Spirochaetes bacterium GWF1_41_5]|nr:MAG: hypothetical protein A2096_09975 [Spirochaetes bacterium GWF1_41_5]
MRKDVKIITTLLIAAMLSGCSSKKQRIVVRFMNLEGSQQQLNIMNIIIRRFEKENPDIHIEAITGFKPEKIMATIASGSGVDIFHWNNTEDFVDRGAIVNLNPFVKKYKFDPGILSPIAIKDYTFYKQLYGMPIQINTHGIIFNMDLLTAKGLELPKEGWDWDDFYNLALKFKCNKEAGEKGKLKAVSIQSLMTIPILASYGFNGFFDEKTARINEKNHPRFIEILTLYQKILTTALPSQEEIAEYQGATGYCALFQMGVAAMQFAPAWLLAQLYGIKDFSWDVIEMPGSKRGQKSRGYHTSAALCLASISKNQDAAFKFMEFYSRTTSQKIYGSGKNGLPANIEAAKFTFRKPPEHISLYLKMLDANNLRLPRYKNSKEYSDRLMPHTYNFLKGEISPETYIKRIEETGKTLLEPYPADFLDDKPVLE